MVLTLMALLFIVSTFFSLQVQTDIASVKNIGTNQIKGMGTSISITVPAAGIETSNSTIVTFAMDFLTGLVSVLDSKGSIYTFSADIGATDAVNKVQALILSTRNIAALVISDTITLTHHSANARAVSAAKFSDLAMASMLALDKSSFFRYYCFTKVIFIVLNIMVPLDNYFNVIEVGRRLKVHSETVKRLCRQGDLPAIKFHNTWLIARDDLDNFAGTYIPKRGARKKLI
jgi:excisionase family DNA binding protein